MDWERAVARRLTRRRFLGAAGGAASAAGLLAAGCNGGSGGGSPSPWPRPGETDEPVTPAAEPTATPRRLSDRHGETLRYTGYVASDGAYDPHKTQAGPFYGQQALVFSRLLSYASQAEGGFILDLATGYELPDAQTLTFTLNGAARWHEAEPMNGRPVTAEDVKFSIERQINGDASFVRRARWSVVDSIEAQAPDRVIVRLKAPFANALGLFADVNSFIVAPELVSNGHDFTASRQVGSGPFRWVEWQEGDFASVARNPNWHGGEQRPYLDGIELRQPKDPAEIEAGLRTKQLDAVFVGRPVADRLKENIPTLVEAYADHSLFFGMRFFINQVPYTDQRFRAALATALDRRAMVARFFAGSGDINPWVSWPIKRWTLPQSELTNYAGYRPGDGGRAADIAEARAQLEAFAAENEVPADLPLFVEADAEATLGLGSTIRDKLAENLGLKVTVYPMQIGDLIRRMFEGEAPWVAAPDIGWIDLDDWLYPYFHSAGTTNSFPLRDPDLDALIEAQRTELDEEARREIGYEVQRRLLGLHVAENFVSERVIALSWPYVKNFPLDCADGYQHRFADTWIDRTDESFRGR